MIPRHSTQLFAYDRATKRLIVEISTLQANSVGKQAFGPVFNDSADEGFILVSHMTGRESKWAVNETLRREGEIVVWILTPTEESVHVDPKLNGCTIHLLND